MKKHRAKEPKRHHYIPQFILRNFRDENDQVTYWDIKNKDLSKGNTRNVFMNMDMYRNDKNENPVQIEEKFSNFEREIAELIRKKILNKNRVEITRTELESLRIFLGLLSFRSDLRMTQYKENLFDETTRNVLLKLQPDGDFVALWKKELDILADCRTFEEIFHSDGIDSIIKMEFENILKGFYMSIVDSRGEDFLITDVYPTSEVFPFNDYNMHLHFLFPISPKRMLVLNNIIFKNGVNASFLDHIKNTSFLKDSFIKEPKNKYKVRGLISKEDAFIYKVEKVYRKDVEYVNALLLNEARVGVMFQDASKIFSSIVNFNNIEKTKQKYDKLENILKK